MNYKLIPRFYYTLPLLSYLKYESITSSIPFAKYRINLNSARTALRLLLSSISNNSLKVGVQAYTCHTVFQAISKAGHTPVFIDIDKNFQMNLFDLKNKATDIDVLIITHTFGFPEQIDKIKEIVGDKIIIEDCAHSFLSKYHKEYTGTLTAASIFSTGLAKFPAIGAGGFCLINDTQKFPDLQQEYMKLEPISFLSATISLFKTLIFSLLMKPPLYGAITYKLGKKLDSKLDFIDKFSFKENLSMKWVNRVYSANFIDFEKMCDKQKTNTSYLSSLLKSKIKGVFYNIENEPNYYAFPILVKNRDQLFDELLVNNIESGKHFSKSLIWAQEFGYKQGDCPNTEKIINQVITLPIYQGVDTKTLKKMAGIVNKYE